MSASQPYRTLVAALLGLAAALSAHAQSNAEFVALGRLAVVVHRPDVGPAPHVAVIYENGDGDVFNSMCTELAKRGFLTLCAIEHANPTAGWENVALNLKSLIEYAHRQPGITHVALYGHSGGGAIASFYQAVAENGIAFCQDPKKLSACKDDLAKLPHADAVVFPDAHPGLGVMSLRMINPSLSSDGSKLRVDPALDPFSRANGFDPAGPSHYTPVFQEKYAKAQAVKMNALIARALDLRARLRSGALTDAAADRIVIQQFGFANHLDELDPGASGLMHTREPRRLLRNDGSILNQVIASVSVGNPAEAPNFAVPAASIATSAEFLSRGAVRARDGIDDIDYCTSNSVTMCNIESIWVPVLFIASGANTFIADEERMYDRSPSADKEYIVVEGALHGGQPCTRCEKMPGQYGNSERNLYNYIRDWLDKRFPLDGPPAAADVEVAPFLLPPSSFSSPESRAILAARLEASTTQHRDAPVVSIHERRAQIEKQMQPQLEKARAMYAVSVEPQQLGGVSVNVVQPAAGVAARNRGRVVIELAGGAFTTATPTGGLLESAPLAAIGGLRVVSVHYRQGPEARFPAASEDVAAVYSELLKHYRPAAIGIYGCSSGAYLTTMSLAWFQTHHLPRPGAVALLCGSAGRIFEGDAFYSAAAFMGHPAPLTPTADHPIVQVDYMRDVKDTDPLAMPINFPEELRQFPPTLLITGTRDIALSTAVYLHTRLVQLGVPADLHVWDGMWHGFMNDPSLPEAHDAHVVIAKFFDRELAR